VVALGITASPRRQGNTHTAMLDLLTGLRDAGTETDEIFLPDYRIEPIASCSACMKAGGCDIGDDFAALMDRLYAADLVLVGTPLYWYGPAGQLKVFLDRWSCLLDLEEASFRDRMRGKRAVIVIAQGERGFYEAGPCLQMLDWTFRYLDMPVAGRIVVVGHASSDYASDPAQRQAVGAAAAALAAGQPVDLQPPWFHLGYRPGTPLGGVFYPAEDGSATE
jgi:multimeric flavodoxin WrbA